MCGISGHSGIHPSRRKLLTIGLAMGIQKRGSHASGYLSIDKNGAMERGRTDKAWMEDPKWSSRCADLGQTVMMHARHATCRNKGIEDAHPFEIKRDGKSVLWGMHNGVIYNADESAKAHGREMTVDSRELLELLADNEGEKIKKLSGYGVVAWIRSNEPHRMYMARMTATADMCMARVKDPTMALVEHTEYNGTIFASTKEILKYAASLAGVELAEEPFELKNHVVYYVDHDGGAFMRDDEKVEIEPMRSRVSTTTDFSGWERGGSFNYGSYFAKTPAEYAAEGEATAERVNAWWTAGEARREKYRQEVADWLMGQDIAGAGLSAEEEDICDVCGNFYWKYASCCYSCGCATPYRLAQASSPTASSAMDKYPEAPVATMTVAQQEEAYRKELEEEREALDAVLNDGWEEAGMQTTKVLAL